MVIDIKKCKEAFTHAGAFHADDVFSTALLLLINPDISITRGFVVPKDFDGIVYDIGGGIFDHHQKNRRVRSNGIPYAAFGLLWESFGTWILDPEDAKNFDESFIQPLDYADNTGEKNEIAQMISDFNATWNHPNSNPEEDFYKAVSFAKTILFNRFQQIQASKEACAIVEEQMKQSQGNILILKKVVPWKKSVIGSQFYYVIYKSKRGGYNIQAVPSKEDSLQLVKPFPEEWRGKSKGELQILTGIQELNFCHMSGFLCSADTLEGAKKVAEQALKKKENNENQ